MDAQAWVIPLDGADDRDEPRIGGKASALARLRKAGFRVAPGFCVTTQSYDRFLEEAGLTSVIQMELGRKPLDLMRWEEIWDAALRLRNRFAAAEMPADVAAAIGEAADRLGSGVRLAVRSSAPGEDSATGSFAGLHDSFLNVDGAQAVLRAVRLVWASLWSDAALLYRRELALDPLTSHMAVLVQEMRDDSPSGVAFGRDPRTGDHDRAIIEAVPGLCAGLVDGVVDPDRWTLSRSSRRLIDWRPGRRDEPGPGEGLLTPPDLDRLLDVIDEVEDRLGWCPDLEWTGRADTLTVLQARPVTGEARDADEPRAWYLTLRPRLTRLSQLCDRVTGTLIPELEATGERMATEDLDHCSDCELADRIDGRQATVLRWKAIYKDEFIPLAHGVRHLGLYFNDAVRPADPYAFIGLLQGEAMLAVRRNRRLAHLACQLRDHPPLARAVRDAVEQRPDQAQGWLSELGDAASGLAGAREFVDGFQSLRHEYMDISFSGERLIDHPQSLLRTILELASRDAGSGVTAAGGPDMTAADLEQQLLDAVGPDRQDEAREILRLGRVSWRLRDDDNLLVARLESQLLRALHAAAARLQAAGRLNPDARVGLDCAAVLADALRLPSAGPLLLPSAAAAGRQATRVDARETPRQLIGQPAAPGFAAGPVRIVRGAQDLGSFRAGEVLVCDAIQPMMTHVVPLAAAVVERRGGMLIHGAIIARELGIPCVNGVRDAADELADGQRVTVDGHLGIVTVGDPEFTLELR